MIDLNTVIDRYETLVAAAEALGTNTTQLARWRDCGAKVDSLGQIWTRVSVRGEARYITINGVEL